MICRPVLIAALCLLPSLRTHAAAAVAASTVEADRTELDTQTGEVILQGNARLTDGTLLLLADEIRSNNTTGVITATGHIVFTRGEIRLLADRLVYTRPTDSFTADNIRLGSYPYFVEGRAAAGSRGEIVIQTARATYGEPGPWQPTVTADKIFLAPGRELRTEGAAVGIGHTQPVPIPRFDHKFGAPLFGTASLTGGYRRSLGVFVDATLLVPVTPDLRLGADLGVYTSRGVMVGPSGRYARATAGGDLSGYFRSGYINDHGDKKTDLLGRPIPEDRTFAEWQHRQKIGENVTLSAQLNWWQDSEVLRDFRPRAFFPVQEPDTFVESVYTGSNYFLSAFARFQPNRFHAVQERLPELRFDLLPLAVGNGFYQRLSGSAAVLREDPVLAGPTLRTDRLDAYYALSRPFAPAEWLAFTPVAGGRLTHYTNTRVGGVATGNYLRLLGELGADVALRTSGTFDYKNPAWRIDGLRHLLTPRLSYRYLPEAAKGRAIIPNIDRRAFSTYLQPLGLGDQRNLDDLHATNTLRLGLDNILQTRDAREGTRDLLAFNVASDFRFQRAPGERDVSDLHADVSLTPAPWLQFDVYQSFSPRNFTIQELNSSVTLRDGRLWSLRFGNNFLRQQLQDYAVDVRYRLNERFEALTRLHYDARKHRFNEQSYGVVQNLGNTWLLSYTVSVYSGRKRESNFGLNVQIDTVRF